MSEKKQLKKYGKLRMGIKTFFRVLVIMGILSGIAFALTATDIFVALSKSSSGVVVLTLDVFVEIYSTMLGLMMLVISFFCIILLVKKWRKQKKLSKLQEDPVK